VGIPRTRGLLHSPWQPLGIPSATTPISQLHQSPPSHIPGDLGWGPSHQSHVLEHRDTYGQAQVCSKGHQGSSVDRPCHSVDNQHRHKSVRAHKWVWARKWGESLWTHNAPPEPAIRKSGGEWNKWYLLLTWLFWFFIRGYEIWFT